MAVVRPSWGALILAAGAATSGCADPLPRDTTTDGVTSANASAGLPMAGITSSSDERPSVRAIGADSGATFPGPWCPESGRYPAIAFGAAVRIASAYWFAQMESCATAALTNGMTDRQSDAWLTYLVNYTYLMMGCPVDGEVVEGGISVFGPANLAALGLGPRRLGRDDVARVIAAYVAAFVGQLALDAEAEERLSMQLWGAAEALIDVELRAVLSLCEGDAGASSSIGDAGA